MIDSIDTQEEYRPKAKVFYVVTSRAELENWASNNTSLDGDEIKQIGNYELTKDHLDLVSDNNQDAGIVSFVYGMTPYHLDKFRRFIPTEKGMRELVEFDRKWLGQAERFDHVENDAEFLREHYLEAIASSAQARTYWILANRDRAGELWTFGEDSISPQFGEEHSLAGASL